jgi:hypothetical protein
MSERFVTNNLLGGVGNQMFQIAAGYSLAKDLGINYTLCDARHIKIGGQGNNLPQYKDSLYKKISYRTDISDCVMYYAKNLCYYPLAVDLSGSKTSICLQGFFQSEKNFMRYRSEIRDLFTPDGGYKNWISENSRIQYDYPELFEDHDYVFIGVRRGDYLLNARIHNPCEMNYYREAIKRLPSARYYIASDDIEWCKKSFVGSQFVFFDISMENDLEQLAAMTLFKKYIISNSSFYWWGSYLSCAGDDAIVVAPNKWMSPPHDIHVWRSPNFIYRESMIILDR